MQRDVNKWLEDISSNGRDCLEFLEEKTESAYLSDKALRAMVERKLFIVGEALSQIKATAPEVADRVASAREIIGFRNLLAHGYFALDHRRVYDIARNSLPDLLMLVEKLLVE